VVISLDATGRHLYAVPPGALQVDAGKPALVLNSRRTKIAADANDGRFIQPQMHNPTWAAVVYRRYGLVPDFAPDPGPPAASADDATPQTEGGRILVKIAKPGSARDDAITRAIVSAWVEAGLASELSENHTRIVVEGGKVTLRGGARDERQRQQLYEMATNVAGVGNVEDDLEIGN
jgi:osmotically-inducible protein OsmY